MKLASLNDDELREVSMQRGKNGNYTSDALRAQHILWNRNHWGSRPTRYTQISSSNWDGSVDNIERAYEEME